MAIPGALDANQRRAQEQRAERRVAQQRQRVGRGRQRPGRFDQALVQNPVPMQESG